MSDPRINPYAAPTARLDDAKPAAGAFVSIGASVTSGQGWRWLKAGFALFMRQPAAGMLITMVFVLIQATLTALQVGFALVHPALGFLVAFAGFFVTPILIGGWMLGCRELDEGRPLRVGHLLTGIDSRAKPLAALGAWMLVVLIGAMLVMAVAAGIIGFAVFSGGRGGGPGAGTLTGIAVAVSLLIGVSIFVYSLLWFAPALVVLNNMSALEAMRASIQGCMKNIVPFLIYGGCTIGLAIAASIPFMLGWLVLAPVLIGSIYAAYRDIYFAKAA